MGPALRSGPDPIVVDLGFGASPITTVELAQRLAAAAGRRLKVVGLEIDPGRVAAAEAFVGPGIEFRVGGFEVPLAPDQQPLVIRAANVLRQYDEAEVVRAWEAMARRLTPGGMLVEGTCDELGRLAAWVAIPARGPDRGPAAGPPWSRVGAPGQAGRFHPPETLTLSVDLAHLERPSRVAERLPKALIHRNVPGEPVHALLAALDDAWARSAPQAAFGPRQRWIEAVAVLRDGGWPVRDGRSRWRLGELTVPWSAVAPVGGPLGSGS
jgi:SAM-dependent methyltransferase